MILKLVRSSAGLFLLYDGVRGLLSPAGYRRHWQTGILTLDDMFDYASERPELTRKLALFEISAGIWLTLR
ncbi:MAG: hypothetical protein M3Y72_19190 [Acidobacteriota bacterium]|nr:hypothetical protein [Acidobacteriota bacterium]